MCVFCDIVEGRIPSNKVYENDKVLCFRDINPVAPTHVLVVPKKHFDNIVEVSKDAEGAEYLDACAKAIAEVASSDNLDSGFRVINNCGPDGGQTVMHLHFHVIGGVKLTEKMI